jgi:uncharacterized glyoxalase superfamily protein PhnB
MSAPSPAHPSLSTALVYRDPRAALLWLEQAFGFEPFMVIVDANDNPVHSEMRFGDGMIMVGSEWSDDHKSPASIGGKCTQTVHVHLTEAQGPIDAHCEQARRAGAKILMEPEEQFYGDRSYRAVDLEGHIWTFGQTVRSVAPEEYEKTMGLKTRTRL